MELEKFKSEVETLKKFFTTYCYDKHTNQQPFERVLEYKNEKIKVNLKLCDECSKLLNYSFDRLIECPHEIKPRCRKCPNPCYEKKEWKQVAKLMMYSGMKLGLTKLRNFAKKIFNK
jgi:predicted amidophosphoribosyltransferase